MKHAESEGRFPDVRNAPRPGWRDALRKLAAPAERLHRYKVLQSEAVDELITDSDCRGRT